MDLKNILINIVLYAVVGFALSSNAEWLQYIGLIMAWIVIILYAVMFVMGLFMVNDKMINEFVRDEPEHTERLKSGIRLIHIVVIAATILYYAYIGHIGYPITSAAIIVSYSSLILLYQYISKKVNKLI